MTEIKKRVNQLSLLKELNIPQNLSFDTHFSYKINSKRLIVFCNNTEVASFYIQTKDLKKLRINYFSTAYFLRPALESHSWEGWKELIPQMFFVYENKNLLEKRLIRVLNEKMQLPPGVSFKPTKDAAILLENNHADSNYRLLTIYFSFDKKGLVFQISRNATDCFNCSNETQMIKIIQKVIFEESERFRANAETAMKHYLECISTANRLSIVFT